MKTLAQILTQNQHNHDAIALSAPGRSPLSYADLYVEIQKHSAVISSLSLHRDSAVAMVLPNGPEMAVAFLSTAVTCSAAPLNPAYRQAEFEDYFTDLRIEAVILPAGDSSPARSAAQKLGVPLLEMVVDPSQPAGIFTWAHQPANIKLSPLSAGEDDIALLLHTSGTTSRPKIVPLTHKNLYTTAGNITRTLQLTPNDRCLNVMPFFHTHGLIVCLIGTIFSAGSIVCTGGFLISKFFNWVQECEPTWFSAVPTMHQAIITRAPKYNEIRKKSHIRVIRSSSAALPPSVIVQLEEIFHAVVSESYGLTESAHHITTPLPLEKKKTGSVGQVNGRDLAIFTESGEITWAPGSNGEIVLRGENVTKGYLRNPEANQKAFTEDGWFRTGDLGRIDEDSCLYVTGRIKEIINRGGEKIAPREIDEALLLHPSVKHAVAFSVPDSKLGEEVAAAVVLHQPDVSEKDLKHFLSSHLAHFKIPRRILFLDEIPKGPTGKLQRIGLAEKLGLTSFEPEQTHDDTPPASSLEIKIAAIWSKVLEAPQVGRNQSFISLGGDSILIASLVISFHEEFGVSVPLIDLFDAPTVAEQAILIQQLLD